MIATRARDRVRCPRGPHPFFFCVAALLAILPAPAIAQTLTWGLKAGLSVATLHIDAADLTLAPTLRLGAVAGAFVEHPITSKFGFQVEALISQMGTIIRDPRFDGDLKVRLKYLEVPALAHYRVRLSPSVSAQVAAGPVFSVKLGDVQHIGDGELTDEEKQQLATTDVALSVGGAALIRNTTVDLRYTFGLKNINDDRDRDELIVRNRAVTISIGRRF